MTGINFEDLLSTGAHFGHVTKKWHPGFKKYILMEKNGIHIINLDETVHQFEKAAAFIKGIVDRGGEVLFVGTKKQAREIVQQEADRCGMFYVVERWLGGTLTNFMTIKKSIKRLHLLEKEGSSIYKNLTKKEVQMLNRERIKLADQHRGIKDMKRLPDALIVVDSDYESTAVAEARRLEIPVIGMIDTNTDPSLIDFPIPANDDSIRAIQLIISSIAEVIIDSRKEKIAAAAAVKDAEEAAKAAEAEQVEETAAAVSELKPEPVPETDVETSKETEIKPADEQPVKTFAADSELKPEPVPEADAELPKETEVKQSDDQPVEAVAEEVKKPELTKKPATKAVAKKPVKAAKTTIKKSTAKKPVAKKTAPKAKKSTAKTTTAKKTTAAKTGSKSKKTGAAKKAPAKTKTAAKVKTADSKASE